ncbi:MAG TPA: histidinol-phosphate transaminase [Xanthomonadaceae bacterium]|nr:histidinol-phosphate transaminase [Xanthomonadaceae bacterium]
MNATAFDALATASVRSLRAYDPGHDLVALRRRFGGLLELGANESPYGPSPRAVAAVHGVLGELHRYPDPLGGDLKRALAAHLCVDAAALVLGNGSHELLMQLAQVFAGPGAGVAMSRYGFAVYAIAAHAVGAPLTVAEALPADHAMARGHDLPAIATAARAGTRLVYLANPNNPTGTWFERPQLRRFLEGIGEDVIVVVDQAYREYVDPDKSCCALPLLRGFRNLVVTGTFSKAYGLAGLRVGYAVADPGIVALLERLRESFNVNSPALAAAIAALGDQEHVARAVAGNRAQRERIADALRVRGLVVHPSQTNFVLVDLGADTPAIERALVDRGVVTRPMGGYGLPQCLRVSLGAAGENDRFLDALDGVMR